MRVQLFTDGGSRGNPGKASSGSVVLDEAGKVVLARAGYYLGVTTNNQAEYQGLIRGFLLCRQLGAREVAVFMDSNLIVNQMLGKFRVKNAELRPRYLEACRLAGEFERVTFTHVYREYNKLADKMVNRALDEGRDVVEMGK